MNLSEAMADAIKNAEPEWRLKNQTPDWGRFNQQFTIGNYGEESMMQNAIADSAADKNDLSPENGQGSTPDKPL